MAETEAYELEHRGAVHRAASFDVLLKWAEELRMDAGDRYRPAGTEDWFPVMKDQKLSALLSPENRWRVRMASGEYSTGGFETITKWAREGRLSTDAVVEGPRTPPGGVQATALPALSAHLVEAGWKADKLPRLRIDGRVYAAPDVETISRWISESRVPVEAQISLADGPWEPVGSCGLFDLETWPQAALGDTGDLPGELPEPPPAPVPGPSPEVPPEFAAPVPEPDREATDEHPLPEGDASPEKFRVVTGSGVEYECEDPAEMVSLARKRRIMEYDEVRHSSLPGGSASVGAVLDLVRRGRRGKGSGWRIAALFLLAAAAVFLADTVGWIQVPWLP